MHRRDLAGHALGAVGVSVAILAAFLGSTRQVSLNLGPGDSAFVRGFEPDHDVDDKVGWHWTTYDAVIDLPFETEGSGVEATFRYARVFGEEAVVSVNVGSVATEAFRARGGEVRRDTLRAAGVRGPLVLTIRTDSHERRNMGLRMDRVDLSAATGAPFKLRSGAAVRPALGVALLFGGLLALGSGAIGAGALALLASLAFAMRAHADLFEAWRQTSAALPMLVLSTVVLLAGRFWLERGAGLPRRAAALLSSAAFVAMLLRVVFVSHPDFYYPDLLTHTRVVEAIREEGLSFFLHPADALSAQGAWTKPVLGGVSSLPYAVLFHTLFAIPAWLFNLSTDEIETALKCGSSLISVLPVLVSGALAARLGLPPLSALLLCVIPTYTSRLSFALLPALLGHVFDLVALLTIATVVRVDEARSLRSGLYAMTALALGHLAYTSGVVNEAVFMGAFVLLCLVAGPADRALGVRLSMAEAFGAFLAFVFYYRHFVGDVFGLVARLLGVRGGGMGAEGSGSVYPVESFWGLLFERTNTFFGWPWISLALLGLWLSEAEVRRSREARAWALAYLVLIALRARIPDVFRYGHETLFVTPLVALLAGSALVLAFRRGGVWRAGALVFGSFLSAFSLWQQWAAIVEQFGNAR